MGEVSSSASGLTLRAPRDEDDVKPLREVVAGA